VRKKRGEGKKTEKGCKYKKKTKNVQYLVTKGGENKKKGRKERGLRGSAAEGPRRGPITAATVNGREGSSEEANRGGQEIPQHLRLCKDQRGEIMNASPETRWGKGGDRNPRGKSN